MSLFKRAPRNPERIEPDPQPSFASRCRHLRTRSGRTAHLEHPESGVVLCQWPGADTEADPALPVCRMCKVAAGLEDERRLAS